MALFWQSLTLSALKIIAAALLLEDCFASGCERAASRITLVSSLAVSPRRLPDAKLLWCLCGNPAQQLRACVREAPWSAQFKGYTVCGWLTRSSMPPPLCSRHIQGMFSFTTATGQSSVIPFALSLLCSSPSLFHSPEGGKRWTAWNQ